MTKGKRNDGQTKNYDVKYFKDGVQNAYIYIYFLNIMKEVWRMKFLKSVGSLKKAFSSGNSARNGIVA